jgi:hypothetical protein
MRYGRAYLKFGGANWRVGTVDDAVTECVHYLRVNLAYVVVVSIKNYGKSGR